MKEKIGRNDPCPCGSGKKYKKCCFSKEGSSAEDGFDQDDLRRYGEMLENRRAGEGPSPTFREFTGSPNLATESLNEMTKLMEGRDFGSAEEMNAFMQNRVNRSNAAPAEHFLGLSPNQMHRVLDGRIEELPQILKLNTGPDASLLENVPVMRHARFLYERIAAEEKGVKATQKGNLPLRLVREFHERFIRPGLDFDHSPRGEDEVFSLQRIKYFLRDSGFIKFRTGRYSSTAKGRKMFKQFDPAAMYKLLFLFCMEGINWLFGTYYPEPLSFIQRSRVFCLYLLQQKAGTWISGEELARVYLKAFPSLAEDIKSLTPHGSEMVTWGFEGMFLNRSACCLGLAEKKKTGENPREMVSEYRTTPLFRQFIQWKV